MKVLKTLLIIATFSGVLAQYGNPNKNKNKRPTTTTEIPESLNEVVPGVSVQPNYPGQQPNYNPQPQPGFPQQPSYSPQPQPGFPQQPSQPGFNPQPQPARPGYAPQPGSSNAGNNFQGVNAPSSSDYWWAGPNSPFKPGSQPAPGSPQRPQPQRPGYAPQPQPQPQPQKPYQPQHQQPQPQPPYQPQPQQPYQPQPQPQPQQPYQPQPQPQQPYQPQPQPQQPYQPQPQKPFQPQPQPQAPFQQQPKPQQPGFPSQPSRPQPGYGPNPGKPSSPSFPPNQPQSPYKPPTNNPAFPDQNQPYRPSNQGNTPLNVNNNPYLSSALQNPVPIGQGQSCNGEGYYCVPSQSCYNGQISDNSGQPHLKYKKGPCSGGYVCCKASQPQYPQQPAPQQQYPQQQYPQPGQPNTPYNNRPAYGTEPSVQKYTGPLNTTPYPGCAAALKCVDISYCTAEGVMSDTPVALTYEQSENRVPLSDCLDMDTGIIGKCCRDPNYKDPWPAGMMMNKGFDDGQYHPEHHGQPTSPQPYQPQPTSPPQQQYKPPNPPPPSPQKPYSPPPPPQQPYNPQSPPPSPQQPYNPQSPPPPQQPYNPPSPPPPAPQQPYSPPQTPPPPQPSFNAPPTAPQQPTYSPQTPAPPAQPPYNPPQNPPVQPPPQPTSYPVAPKPGQTHSQVFPANEDKVYGSPNANAGINQIGLSGSEPKETNLPQSSSPPTTNPQSPEEPHPVPKPNPATVPQTSYNQPPSPPSPDQECGVKGPSSSSKPDEASFGEFPWHAIIASDNGTALCSGAIIAPNAVLTVAHCVQSVSPITLVIKVGVWSLGQPGPKPEQTISVAVAAIHPAYDQGSRVKDQAVIITQQPVQFDEHVKKVCLPKNQGTEYSPKGGSCFATGFGRPTLQSGTPGTVLHKIEIKILPKSQCESQLQQTHLGKYFFLNDGSSCAAPPSKSDLCKLDFGSPIVCDKGDGHYEVAGAYSWDTQCNSPAPGVLSNPDTDWILDVLDTPVETLKEQQKKPEIDTSQPEDIDSKPGFALGYGR